MKFTSVAHSDQENILHINELASNCYLPFLNTKHFYEKISMLPIFLIFFKKKEAKLILDIFGFGSLITNMNSMYFVWKWIINRK